MYVCDVWLSDRMLQNDTHPVYSVTHTHIPIYMRHYRARCSRSAHICRNTTATAIPLTTLTTLTSPSRQALAAAAQVGAIQYTVVHSSCRQFHVCKGTHIRLLTKCMYMFHCTHLYKQAQVRVSTAYGRACAAPLPPPLCP